MPLNLVVNQPPHNNINLTVDYGNVYVLIGKNRSGKSKLLRGIKKVYPDAVLLTDRYETIKDIESVNQTQSFQQQTRENYPLNVASLVANDKTLLKIFQYYFKILFDSEITVASNKFQVNGIEINNEADGLKSIFNLLYYLVSSHSVLLLDEPERFFHPTIKNIFITLVSEIAKNYKKIIILTSHSEEAIRFDLNNLQVWLIRSPILNINDWIQNVSDSTYSSARDKSQFIDWISFHSEVFFSQTNCLVEGLSDQIVLTAVRNKLALKYHFEGICISHVASSHHEAGGKSRLHKFQSFLSKLNRTFTIADLDVINADIQRWFPPATGRAQFDIMVDAKHYQLEILSRGEIEDYYFTNSSYIYCTTIVNAKNQKISAAYEQAGIISKKSIEDVESQFSEIVEMLKSYASTSSADNILKSIAKDYLFDKYGRGSSDQTHLEDSTAGNVINIKFRFTGQGKSMTYPQEELKKIKDLDTEIDKNLI